MGLTFDTGALIGLERARHHMRKVYDTAVTCGVPITVPSVVVAEWWRAGVKEKERAQILRSVRVEAISDEVARLAGAALTLVRGVQTIDAIVMASAAQRGREVVYTSDPDDLLALRDGVRQFAAIRVERA
jgi:predicted nucleic acid-binding protein